MKFHGYFAALLCCGLLLSGCDSSTTICDPAVDPNACVAPPQCSGVMQDCKNGGLDGCETDTSQDVNNCGRCGNVCPAPVSGQAVCEAGTCSSATCGSRFLDCNGDPSDGCETDSFRNVNNCGLCGKKCPGAQNAAPVCSAGQCKLLCQAGFLDCNGDKSDGCEKNGSADASNCGTCGNVCTSTGATNAVCLAGSCSTSSCTTPFLTCLPGPVTNCETDSSSDVNNCGACTHVCDPVDNGTPGCANSNCGIKSCNTNFKDCNGILSDGCEINLQGNVDHCGACDTPCNLQHANPKCVTGVCGVESCTAGFGNCNNDDSDGCEHDVSNDTLNCGSCGNKCTLNHANPKCVSNTCVVDTCVLGFANCNMMNPDGCEINVTNDVHNCGVCKKECDGQDQLTGDAFCLGSSCDMKCHGENYDVNKDAKDGCELFRGTPPGHSNATAFDFGVTDCFDFNNSNTFSSVLLSDSRPHNPEPENFNFFPNTGSAPDFWKVKSTGGTLCQNDYSVTFTTSGGTAASCYAVTISTDLISETKVIGGTGTVTFGRGAGSYSDNSTIFFGIAKICSLPAQEKVTYTVSYHL